LALVVESELDLELAAAPVLESELDPDPLSLEALKGQFQELGAPAELAQEPAVAAEPELALGSRRRRYQGRSLRRFERKFQALEICPLEFCRYLFPSMF
jgi:hypothetical protein